MLKYHHSRSLDSVVFGEVKHTKEFSGETYRAAYLWLEKEIGFFPIFLSVGTTDEDIRMTGYQNQWMRLIAMSNSKRIYRKKSEFPNYILFSYEELDGVFTDYNDWHIALNSGYKDCQLTDYEKRLILKPSWSRSKWLSHAKNHPHSVQLVTKSLDLSNADRIWVRNIKTKTILEQIGFKNIEVKRLLIK